MRRGVLFSLTLSGKHASDQFKHRVEIFGERDESKVRSAGQSPLDRRSPDHLRDNHASVYHPRAQQCQAIVDPADDVTQSSERADLSGWCTSRHPESGNLDLTGRFTRGPLGRDVAGWLATEPLSLLAARHRDAGEQLSELAIRLERERGAPVEFEFELTRHRARPTRVRNARMQPLAYVAAMHDLVRTGVVSRTTPCLR